ncbi:unnamed protein product [Fraxinus pennsylvanica]|uniref:Reverse transcriptase zinc-binding domain-containing protein n=1 Tax=Fraxinus pennsylvanica TaxID=56036 RepID=A0AAD1ZI27_9LAMI|nr:unnamed protein product [Fraxinus pennsylvanica]
MKTAWEVVRIRGELVQWVHWVWHNALQKRVSVLMWKALNGSLSVDEKIKAVSINLAAKCDCCPMGHEETASHILSSGEFADKIWKKVSLLMGVRWRARQPWWESINLWWARAKKIFPGRMFV